MSSRADGSTWGRNVDLCCWRCLFRNGREEAKKVFLFSKMLVCLLGWLRLPGLVRRGKERGSLRKTFHPISPLICGSMLKRREGGRDFVGTNLTHLKRVVGLVGCHKNPQSISGREERRERRKGGYEDFFEGFPWQKLEELGVSEISRGGHNGQTKSCKSLICLHL